MRTVLIVFLSGLLVVFGLLGLGAYLDSIGNFIFCA
jgi:hypothetical protein